MSDWRLIETAPKNGTVILAGACSTWAKSFPMILYPFRQRFDRDTGKWVADDGCVYEPQPTHWMPLPDASENTPETTS